MKFALDECEFFPASAHRNKWLLLVLSPRGCHSFRCWYGLVLHTLFRIGVNKTTQQATVWKAERYVNFNNMLRSCRQRSSNTGSQMSSAWNAADLTKVGLNICRHGKVP